MGLYIYLARKQIFCPFTEKHYTGIVGNKANAIEAFPFSKDAAMKLWSDGVMGGDKSNTPQQSAMHLRCMGIDLAAQQS